jgi:hypothetical protein
MPARKPDLSRPFRLLWLPLLVATALLAGAVYGIFPLE